MLSERCRFVDCRWGRGPLAVEYEFREGTIFAHTYTYDLAGNRATKTHEEDGTDPVLGYTYDGTGLNQLTTWAGERGYKVDVVGTVGGEDNLDSVSVWNRSAEPDKEFPAQVRDGFYIGRGVVLETSGATDVNAVATDKADSQTSPSGNSTTEPSSGYHEITLDAV